MDPSPVQAPHVSQPHDVPIKTEERARPIPALQTLQTQAPPPQRVQRYKDKFQALRERYETVTTTHTEYTRAVQRATEKEQCLQAEINMLLDAALASTPQIQTPQPPPASASASASAPASASSSIPVPVPVLGAPGASGTAQSTTTTPTPVYAQLPSPALEPQQAASLHSRPHSPHAPHAHTNGHAALTAPYGHAHGHAYGPTNHAPSGRAQGSSAARGIIPNERAAEAAPF